MPVLDAPKSRNGQSRLNLRPVSREEGMDVVQLPPFATVHMDTAGAVDAEPTPAPVDPTVLYGQPKSPIIHRMTLLFDFFYFIAGICALPFLAVKSYRTGKYRKDLPARFGRIKNDRPLVPEDLASLRLNGQTPLRLMLHCVSVGELLSTRLLVDELLAAEERLQIIITTTTDTASARAAEIYGRAEYANRVFTHRYPFDFSFAVQGFLDHVAPDAVALVELEVWPNFTSIADKKHIPLCVINGRVTEKAAKRYRLVKPITAAMFQRMDFISAQTPSIAKRFEALGADPARMAVLPTLKYDAADFSDFTEGSDTLAAAMGIAGEHRVIVGGSVAPGEDLALLQTYVDLKTQHPNLRLALAPRKPEHVPAMLRNIVSAGFRPVLRSQHPDGISRGPAAHDEVLVLDTLGELKKLYRLAFAVYSGRSLAPLGGSDMIEAAAMGKPVCFGPHTDNFAEAVELLVGRNAAVMVPNAAALSMLMGYWLGAPAESESMGRRAREILAAQRGATDKTAVRLLELVRDAEKAPATK